VPGRGQWVRDGRLDRLHPIVELAALERDLADRGLCLEDVFLGCGLEIRFTAFWSSASFSLTIRSMRASWSSRHSRARVAPVRKNAFCAVKMGSYGLEERVSVMFTVPSYEFGERVSAMFTFPS
jgi:hypothetical protein